MAIARKCEGFEQSVFALTTYTQYSASGVFDSRKIFEQVYIGILLFYFFVSVIKFLVKMNEYL